MIAAVRPPALLAVALSAVLSACAGPSPSNPPIGAEIAPRTSCSADAVVPQFVATRAAVLPPVVFERGRGWGSRLSFRVDAGGAPEAIDVKVDDDVDDAEVVGTAIRTAFAGFRFCAPGAYSTATRWTATLRFRPLLATRETGTTEGFVQMFVPAYTRDDVRAGRAGTVRVAGTFADDGHPQALRLVASSGDDVLDRKSLEAMASWQIVFRPGNVRAHPLVMEQPYVYVIR